DEDRRAAPAADGARRRLRPARRFLIDAYVETTAIAPHTPGAGLYSAFFGLVLALLGVGLFLAVRDVLLSDMERALRASGDLIQQDFDAGNAAS
ncbi:hypothetical protein NA612_23225, partial [Salmonella sp. NW378]|uniref:hypothetical protein n=1 Tax=Salmonella sp. NW378 TaxID=2947938 RepID=UPI003F41DC58